MSATYLRTFFVLLVLYSYHVKLIILTVVHGCETWSLTLREEHTEKALEKRMPRITHGKNIDEIIGGSRKILNEEIHNFYSWPNTMRMIKSERMG
jgi:hypothetical protein